jgi:site-specific DNA recombinase
MTAALNALYTGGIERLVVYKLDRLARDLYLTLWLEKEARKFGAEVVSVTEPYRWDDPTQKLLLNIIMSFAELERSLITSRPLWRTENQSQRRTACWWSGTDRVQR